MYYFVVCGQSIFHCVVLKYILLSILFPLMVCLNKITQQSRAYAPFALLLLKPCMLTPDSRERGCHVDMRGFQIKSLFLHSKENHF